MYSKVSNRSVRRSERVQEVLAICGFGGNKNLRITKPQISRTPAFGSRCPHKILITFYYAKWQSFTHFCGEFFSIFIPLKIGFIAKCEHFQGFKTANYKSAKYKTANCRKVFLHIFLFTVK